MHIEDVERIARLTLRELGAGDPPVTVTAANSPDRWQIAVGGSQPMTLTVRAGAGTTANYVREQIFNQVSGR
jgi:hypothetical protein